MYSHASMLRVGIIGASGLHRRRAAAARRPASAVRGRRGHRRLAGRRRRGRRSIPAWPAPTRDLVFEAFDPDQVDGLDVVFLGLPHEASMALAPAARRARRLRRRPLRRLPAEGRRAVPGVLRLRARPAGAARRGGVRPARAAPRRAQGRAPDRHPGLLRHGGDAGVAPARRERRDRDHGRDRRRRLRRHRRRPQDRPRLQLHHRRRELHRLRAARPSPHAGDGAGDRRPAAVHAAPGADEPRASSPPATPARAGGDLTTAGLLELLRERWRDEPFMVVTDGSPSTKATLGSNAVHVTARYDARTGHGGGDRRPRQSRQGSQRRRRAVRQRRARPRRDRPGSDQGRACAP